MISYGSILCVFLYVTFYLSAVVDCKKYNGGKRYLYRQPFDLLGLTRNIIIENLLEEHPTETDIIQKAKSIEKFLFEMPDPSVNGGYKQKLREQRKQREEMDIQMKKSRDEMRERALNRICDKNAKLGNEELKELKNIIERKGQGVVLDEVGMQYDSEK